MSSPTQLALVCRRCKIRGFNPWVQNISWRRAWQPTPVFLPGELMDGGAWWVIQSIGSPRVGRNLAQHSTRYQSFSIMISSASGERSLKLCLLALLPCRLSPSSFSKLFDQGMEVTIKSMASEDFMMRREKKKSNNRDSRFQVIKAMLLIYLNL